MDVSFSIMKYKWPEKEESPRVKEKLQMCQLLSIAEYPFFIPGFSFILHCCIVLDYNHLGSEEVAFYKLF